MISSHFMMVLLVIIGCATTIAVIVIAILEARKMDSGKESVLENDTPSSNK